MRRLPAPRQIVSVVIGLVFYGLIIASLQTKQDPQTYYRGALLLLTLLGTGWSFTRYLKHWKWYVTPLDSIVIPGFTLFALSIAANIEQHERMSVWLWYLGIGLVGWYVIHDGLANQFVTRRELRGGLLLMGCLFLLGALQQALEVVRSGGISELIRQRLYGALADPNNLGIFLAVLLPLLLGLLIETRSFIIRGSGMLFLALMLLVILMTDSRNAWGCSLIGGALFFGLQRRIRGSRLFLLGVLATSIIAIMILIRHNDVRIPFFYAAAQAFIERPLFGYGPFNYQTRLRILFPNGIPGPGPFMFPIWHYEAHNVLLQVAAELGLMGLFCLCAVGIRVGCAAAQSWRAVPASDRGLLNSSIASLVVFGTHTLFDNLTLTLPGAGLVVITLIAMVTPMTKVRRRLLYPVGIALLWGGLLTIAFLDRGNHLIYWTSPGSPARQVTLTFDSVSRTYTDSGWYPSEVDQQGQPFQWTAAPEFSIQVPFPQDADALLQFRIVNNAGLDMLDHLTLNVNGTAIRLLRQNQDGINFFQGIIPQPVLARTQGILTRLAFQTNRVSDPLAEHATDKRPLGLAFGWLRLDAALPPEESLSVRFDGHEPPLFLGVGWHKSEASPDGIPFRWSAAQAFTLNTFLPATNDLQVDFKVIETIQPNVLASLSLTINDTPISLTREPSPQGATLFRGVIPRKALADSHGLTQFIFQTAPITSPRVLGLNNDPRAVGIAVTSFSINPLR